MIRFTASKVDLASKCEGAFAVDQLEEKNEYQDAGNERHDEWEDAINRGEPPEVLASRWPGYTWRAEVKFAIDVATGEGREITAPGKRNYADVGPFEVAGTADVVGTKEGAPLVIGDRKSFDPNVPRAQVNAQLHIAALALGRAWKHDTAEVFIHHEARPLDVAVVDELDMDAFLGNLRDIVAKATQARNRHQAGEPVEFTTGPQCRWCAGFNACPKQRELVALVKTEAVDNQVELLLPLGDDESFANAYALKEKLSLLMKRLTSSLIAAASERPRPIGNGRMFGKVQAQGNEKLDGDIVYEVIKERYGQHIADAAVERSASKKRIKEALSLHGAKGQVAEMERQVLDTVRARGGARREMTTKVEEFPAALLKGVP
jgi:hypothetical protein